jgi:hypothetical protein
MDCGAESLKSTPNKEFPMLRCKRIRRNLRKLASAAAFGVVGCSAVVDDPIAQEKLEALSGNVISGRVTKNGVGIPGVTITLAGSKSMESTTDWSGRYTFFGLANGSYSVRPTKTGCAFNPSVINLNNLTTSATANFPASGSSCTSNASTQVINKKVFLLIFDPTVPGGQRLSAHFGWSDSDALSAGQKTFFETTSYNRMRYTIAQRQLVNDIPKKEDGFDYSIEGYLACINETGPCHDPDGVDYAAIVQQYGICDKVNAGQIDEVWMWGGPFFGFYESRLAGPNGYWYNSPPLEGTTCNKLVPIMGYNYERGLNEVIHNYMHRSESTMAKVYGDWQQDRMSHAFDKFALVAAQSPSFGFSGCGSAHFAPNSLADYEYSNSTNTANSFCDDFFSYPNLHTPSTVLRPTSCDRWNCDELEYYRYWLRHLPAATGTGPDGKLNDWWKYTSNPNAAL